MKKKKRKRSVKYKIGTSLNIIGSILLIVVIALCIPATLPKLMGYKVYTVISGSMEPAIPVGSLVIVGEQAADTIEPDQVIAFYSDIDTGSIITHRVVTNRTVSGEFVTKGDANDQEDVMPVNYDNVIGVVRWSVPYLGDLVTMLSSTGGKIAAAFSIAAAVLLEIVGGLLKKDEE